MSSGTQNGEWSVGRLLNWTRQWLAEKGIDEPRLATELLLSEAMGCAKIELYTQFERVPDEPVRARFRELIQRAANHEPIAYLLGRKEFFSLEFEVSHAVLIPRPETETLVAAVVDHCRTDENRPWSVLDVGTGSGCIAAAVAKYVPAADVVAADVRDEAVDVARRNIDRLGLADQVRVVSAEWFALPPEVEPRDGWDVVVSNPPYVSSEGLASLPATVRDFEPMIALDGGSDGLSAYRALAEAAPERLAARGGIFVEVGDAQSETVTDVFTRGGRFVPTGTWKDQARVDRVLAFAIKDQ